MSKPTYSWVRIGLVGVFALFAVAATVSEARSQFGRPPTAPRPPISPPRPPGGISGISGMPSGISGIGGRPGGISGISGISGIPGGISGISGISGMPGGISGISGVPGGISGISGMGGFRTETEWRCSGCKAVLGRGPVKPSYSSCPQCQAQFRNGFTGFTMTSPPSFSPPPAFTPPATTTFVPPPTTAFSPPAASEPAPSQSLFGFGGGTNSNAPTAVNSASGETPKSAGTAWKVIALVVAALVIICATGGALVWNANRTAVNRRRRYVD